MNEGRLFLLQTMLENMRPDDVRRAFLDDMPFDRRHTLLHDGMIAHSHQLSHERHDVPLVAATMAAVPDDRRAWLLGREAPNAGDMDGLATRVLAIAEAQQDTLRTFWLRFEELFYEICDKRIHRERVESIWRESDTARLRDALRALSLRLQACAVITGE